MLSVIMHFDVFVCFLRNWHILFSVYQYQLHSAMWNPKSSARAWNRHASLPDWNGVYLSLATSVKTSYFNSLWTNTFLSETPSCCQAIWAPMIKRYRFFCMCMCIQIHIWNAVIKWNFSHFPSLTLEPIHHSEFEVLAIADVILAFVFSSL